MSSKYLIRADQSALSSCRLHLYYLEDNQNNTADIEFQFPPKVTQDGRKLNWNMYNVINGRDPAYTFGGTSGREMTLKCEYIVEASGSDTNKWTVMRIKKNLNKVRGIFTGYNIDAADPQGLFFGKFGGNALARFSYPLITGINRSRAFVIKSINFEYSDEMCVQTDNKSSSESNSLSAIYYTTNIVFPIKTTMTINLATYTTQIDETPEFQWQKDATFPKLEDLWY